MQWLRCEKSGRVAAILLPDQHPCFSRKIHWHIHPLRRFFPQLKPPALRPVSPVLHLNLGFGRRNLFECQLAVAASPRITHSLTAAPPESTANGKKSVQPLPFCTWPASACGLQMVSLCTNCYSWAVWAGHGMGPNLANIFLENIIYLLGAMFSLLLFELLIFVVEANGLASAHFNFMHTGCARVHPTVATAHALLRTLRVEAHCHCPQLKLSWNRRNLLI